MTPLVSYLVVAAVILPTVLGSITLLALRHRLALSRLISIGSCAALVVVAGVLTVHASGGTTESYALGNWRAPFGIVLVLDRLSALMLLLTSVLALAVMSYAVVTGVDRKGWHFHPL
ncbi:MAG: monovalent cation/H+ antiporter subunit D, partial [Brevundimonas sp.]|nr:monovalent cation/H+ antiporter subunit D [Brevundimonas sp.]